jgi:putative transposase
MVTPRQKRVVVGAMKEHGISGRKACRLLSAERRMISYQARLQAENIEISKRLRELAMQHPRYGTPLLTVLLRHQLGLINHKRVERIYAEAGLQVPKRPHRKLHHRAEPLPAAEFPDHRWSMDFVSDRYGNHRNFRVLNVIDDFTRELILQVVDTSISGSRVARELKRLEIRKPTMIVSDNGPEFRSQAMLSWAEQSAVKLHFIDKGKPQQNAFVESFNGKFRSECLDLHIFESLDQARRTIVDWQDHYNRNRPHSALGYRSPFEFKQMLDHNVEINSVTLHLAKKMGEGQFWVGNHFDADVRQGFTEVLTKAIDQGYTKDMLADALREQFRDLGNKSAAYWQGLAEHTGLRMREFGRLQGYRKAKAQYYRLVVVLDDRTSDICRALAAEDKQYPLNDAVQVMDQLQALDLSGSLDDARDYVKALAPWVKDDQIVRDDEDKPIGVSGAHTPFPPFHFRCRTTTEMVE